MPIREPMALHGIPNFCGGRVLTNFFNYRENEFPLFFKEVIRVLGTVENEGNNGIVMAYTNKDQEVGASFLEKLGFKCVAITDKYGRYDRETSKRKPGPSSPCKTFIGDWYHDVLPAIKGVLAEMKTAEPSSNLRKKAPPLVLGEDCRAFAEQFRVWGLRDEYGH